MSGTPLFRQEVMDARRDEWLGTIRLQAPRFGWVSLGFGVFALVLTLALLIGGHYTRHAQISGMLVPSRGLLTLTPTAAGTVSRLLVREGDTVRAGEPLLEISGEQDSTSLGHTHAAIAAELNLKRERLQADIQEQQYQEKIQQQSARDHLELLHGQIAQMAQQIALQQQLSDNEMSLYEQWSTLGNSGVVSKVQLIQQHDTALRDLVQLKDLKQQELQLRQQAAQQEADLAEIPSAMASKRNDTERQLADVAQSLAQNAAQRAVQLRAPADGTVVNIQVHPGQAVAAQQALVTVLPAQSELLAELWVPTKAVGFIHPGATVVMRYEAYPYQQFGQHLGLVREVGRSAVSPAELSRLLGGDVKEPRYRVEVALDRQSVLVYGHDEVLKPGMALEADVLMERRRLIEWVFQPLYGFTGTLSTTAGKSG